MSEANIKVNEQYRLNPVDSPSYEQKESFLGYGISTTVPWFSQPQIVQKLPKDFVRVDLEYSA